MAGIFDIQRRAPAGVLNPQFATAGTGSELRAYEPSIPEKRFYKRQGFESNLGKGRDFEISESMRRYPKR